MLKYGLFISLMTLSLACSNHDEQGQSSPYAPGYADSCASDPTSSHTLSPEIDGPECACE
jgi:hypothetical protein